MPRRRAASPRPPDEGESAPKSGWKDKLTAQQLNRKRAADRLLVRENRNKARQTIASLQQRVELLSSQQPDRSVSELLVENKTLEAERDNLRIPWEDAHLLFEVRPGGSCPGAPTTLLSTTTGTQSIDAHTRAYVEASLAVTIASGHDQRPQAEVNHEPGLNAPFNLITELDFRMAVPNSPSPFPEICAALQRPNLESNFSDAEFLEAIMIWRSNTSYSGSVYNVSSRLFHIHRPPSCGPRKRLRNLAHTRGILHLLVQDLEASEPSSVPVCDSMVPTNAPEDDDSLATTKRELAIATYGEVRFWKYGSRLGRIVMFWVLYRILTVCLPPPPSA
ncbi:hypothetical protein Z517_06821 [Fonsecaea pedrosoi CBS 271.37]|uniref:BZIP domain-containing protein n=1 Tax=Fonsecaea pedrosoi CBS 271.37 TaxID=1442368 RepID=A0A0D2DQV3_9EURO|nr:uncharacterized protein Z517_06821 [Fonsecaea pedrosoi CBS 271.37]KIW80206.1 hypothetical protein Z517_06821 [Fonsecaea pedrosoi CBS 271.37]